MFECSELTDEEYRQLYDDLRVYAIQVPDPDNNVAMSDQGYNNDQEEAIVGLMLPLINSSIAIPTELMRRLRQEAKYDPYWAPEFRDLEKAQKKLRQKTGVSRVSGDESTRSKKATRRATLGQIGRCPTGVPRVSGDESQSEHLVIDLFRCGLEDSFAVGEVEKRLRLHERVKKVVVIDKDRRLHFFSNQ
ncbi:hypothetical protein [Schaalia sp. lx-260]|uniref:hypothetical protein n=1 Tax=Schaalia sp. lx-260 TaxID=2899082 RepID=UPI001E4A7C9B|nr:hypothetical protein [Schaalia sp. lx-260]MCD4550388.1 hypothetical protein [Schaalia sp. lx-260]